jgi:hypothetical protein|tara:strand:+ start:196 stop:432 length:237 start_codon:yes stop_codon:yes gene_type:complete
MIITVEGRAHFGSTTVEYIADMLRYDEGEILFMLEEEKGDNFLAVIQCEKLTEDRWNSFGLTVRESYYRFPLNTAIIC